MENHLVVEAVLGFGHSMRTSPFIIFAPSFEQGGVERMLVNLANGMAGAGRKVELWINHDEWPILKQLSPEVFVYSLGNGIQERLKRALCRLEHIRPKAILASKEENCEQAIVLRKKSGLDIPLVFRAAVDHGGRNRQNGFLRTYRMWRRIRSIYPRADHVIAVSEGVSKYLKQTAKVDNISILPNPVIHEEIYSLAREPVDHPWLCEESVPVIIGIGRLSRQKNFSLLLDAFAKLRQVRPCRLILLGEGKYRSRLQSQIERLRLEKDVSMPGFSANPYSYLGKADVFVLSSLWEGSPNVLTEALALGIPSVSTECPSGPFELLQGGTYGPLVPLDDSAAMAEAILNTLEAPLPPDVLRRAVTDYTLENSARRYIDVLDEVSRRRECC